MALGLAGKADVTLAGDGELPGRMRRPRKAEVVASRVAKFRNWGRIPEEPRGVQTLNPGFFELERLRASGAAKKRSVLRKVIVG